MKHTQGPWIWSDNKTLRRQDTFGTTGIIFQDGFIGPTKADATLIAMAPDLLEALETYVKDFPDDDQSYYVVYFRTIIKRAKGGIK